MNLKKSATTGLLALNLLPAAPGQTTSAPAAPLKDDASLAKPAAPVPLLLEEPLKTELLAKAGEEPEFAKALSTVASTDADMKQRGEALTVVLKSLPNDRERKEFLADLQTKSRQDLIVGMPHAMEMIELVVKKGADKGQKNADGQNMMFDAVFSGKPENITRMAELEVKPDERDLAGKAPLSYALPNSKLVDRLLAADAKAEGLFIQNNDETLLYKALTEGFSDSAKSLVDGGTGVTSAIIGGERLPVRLLQLDKSICNSDRKLKGLGILLKGGMDPDIETLGGVPIALVITDLRNENPVVKNDSIDPAALALAMLVYHDLNDDTLYSTNENSPSSSGAPQLIPAFERFKTTIAITKNLEDRDLTGAASYPEEFFKYAVAVNVDDKTMQKLLQVPKVQDWLANPDNMSVALDYAKTFDQDALYQQLSNVSSLQASQQDPQLIAAAYITTYKSEDSASAAAGSSSQAQEKGAPPQGQPDTAPSHAPAATTESEPQAKNPGTAQQADAALSPATPNGVNAAIGGIDSGQATAPPPSAPPPPDPQLLDPFYIAVTHGDVAAFEKLIAGGADTGKNYTINRELGITGKLLHLVAEYADGRDAVKMAGMLEGRIDPKAQASNGWNAVNFAAENGNGDLILYLRDKNVPLNCSEQRVGYEDAGVLHGYNALDSVIDGVHRAALAALLAPRHNRNNIVNQLSEEEVIRSIRRAEAPGPGHKEMATAIAAALRVRRPASDNLLIAR